MKVFYGIFRLKNIPFVFNTNRVICYAKYSGAGGIWLRAGGKNKKGGREREKKLHQKRAKSKTR